MRTGELVWLVLGVVFLLPPRATAQDPKPLAAGGVAYIEFGGNTAWTSLNLEFMPTPNLAVRMGVAPVPAFPLMLNYLPGWGPHRAEMGIGAVLGTPHGEYVTATLGYRYQRREGGLVFRAGLTPFAGAGVTRLWAGLSIGVSFRPPTSPDTGGG